MKLTTIGALLAGLAALAYVGLEVSRSVAPAPAAIPAPARGAGVAANPSEGEPGADERTHLPTAPALALNQDALDEGAEAVHGGPSAFGWASWRAFELATSGLFEGTADPGELLEVAIALVERADRSGAEWSKKGTRAFTLVDDPEHGQATLHVHPGRAGEWGEFELEVHTAWVPDYRGSPRGMEGNDLSIHFGLAGEGGGVENVDAMTKVRFSGSVDERIPNEGAGKIRYGAILKLSPDESHWREMTFESYRADAGDYAGELMGKYAFGPPERVHAGSLADDPRGARLAGLLKSLRL